MLIEFQSLKLHNFKSFLSAEFDFSKYSSGLHFIRGINKAKTKYESNGAGKSSLFNAICWCLFGKDTDKLIAGNIGNWGKGKDCSVSLTTNEFELFRSWKPNDLILSLSNEKRKVEDTEVEQLINFSFDAFLYSIITGQFSSQFLDLDPADKLNIFSSVLDLDIWEKYSTNARLLFDTLEADIVKLENRISNTEYALQESEKEDFEKAITEYEEGREDQIKEINEQIEAIEEKMNQWTKISSNNIEEMKRIEKSGKRLKEELEEKEISAKQLNDELYDDDQVKENKKNMDIVSELGERINEIEVLINTYENEILRFDERSNISQKGIDNYRNLEIGSKCSKCGNIIKGDHIDKEIMEIEEKKKGFAKKKKELELEKKKQQNEIAILENRKNEFGEKIKAYLEDIESISKKLAQVNSDITLLKKRVGDNEREIEFRKDQIETEKKRFIEYEKVLLDYRKEIKKIRNTENPYTKLKEEAERKQRQYRKKIRDLKTELKEAKAPQVIAKDWIKGFRNVRLMVVEEALEELQLITNVNIERLGLEDWTIEYLVDRETKKKTIKKGFEVYVRSPHNTELVPIKAYSGGERGRLRLGSTFGLSDFLVDRNGTDFDIRFHDEPTQWLSPEGIDDLLNFLKEEADSKNRKIFIVDQNELESGYFDTITTIIKDKKRGSYVE